MKKLFLKIMVSSFVSCLIIQPSIASDDLEDSLENCDKDDKKICYSLVKDGVAGDDHLIFVHGYRDNKSVCEWLAKTGNEESSVLPGYYRCVAYEATGFFD